MHLKVVASAPIAAEVRRCFPEQVWAQEKPVDVAILELGAECLELCRRLTAPTIFLVTAQSAPLAIEAMKLGAFDCLAFPFEPAELQRTVSEAMKLAATRIVAEPERACVEPEGLFGSGPAMLAIYKSIGRVAAQDVNVLITGETGTGKEAVARAIHEHGSRAGRPFVALNCAAIPETLLESELFGHERGAFTGADRRRIGKFEQCNGGTLLLDEIGDMPLPLQAKILRVLQEKTFERVGGNETIHTDVRVIASTHRDLAAWSAQERFRQDLYYRLRVFTIHLPPLRERGDDVALLARHFVRRFARELRRDVREIDPSALRRLADHSWPGNVRELQSVLKQAILHATGSVLLPEHLPDLAPLQPGAMVHGRETEFCLKGFIREQLDVSAGDVYATTHQQVDRFLVQATLQFVNGNVSCASRVLGISRETLRTRIRALGMRMRHSLEDHDDAQLAS
jgi:two-component system nitrogen regulation response regulator GlnG